MMSASSSPACQVGRKWRDLWTLFSYIQTKTNIECIVPDEDVVPCGFKRGRKNNQFEKMVDDTISVNKYQLCMLIDLLTCIHVNSLIGLNLMLEWNCSLKLFVDSKCISN